MSYYKCSRLHLSAVLDYRVGDLKVQLIMSTINFYPNFYMLQ